MPTFYLIAILAAGLGVSGCNRTDRDRRGEPAARQVGREAYDASQDIKRGAKKAAQELRKAGKELRKGWNEERREDQVRRK